MIFGVWENVQEVFVGIMLLIDSVIYGFISKVYQVFLYLAQGQIFSSETFEGITSRIYIIIGTVMLFIVTYSLLRAIINPDNFTKDDKSFTKIAMNVITSIVLIGIVPMVFDFAYSFQNAILTENILGKIILGQDNYVQVDEVLTKNGYVYSGGEYNDYNAAIVMGGNRMATDVWMSFFQPSSGISAENVVVDRGGAGWNAFMTMYALEECESITGPMATVLLFSGTIGEEMMECSTEVADQLMNESEALGVDYGEEYSLTQAYTLSLMRGSFDHYSLFNKEVVSGDITYMMILSTIAGIFVLYILVSFCIDLGVRVVKLAFFQLIAPIPILSRIMPGKNSVFNNWLQNTGKVFLEVFIRVLVIFFGIFILDKIPEAIENIFGGNATGAFPGVKIFVKLFLILGVLMFIKQAPKLISDTFGFKDSNMKLGIMDKLKESGVLTGAAVVGGAVGAGITTGFRNFNQTKGNFGQKLMSGVAGAGSGAFRGGKAGAKAKSLGDLKQSTSGAINAATQKKEERELYNATRGDSKKPMFVDNLQSTVTKWATGKGSDEAVGIQRKAYSEQKSLVDKMYEEAYKKDESARMWNNQFNSLNETAIDPETFRGADGKINTAKYEAAVKERDALISKAKEARDAAANRYIALNAYNQNSIISSLASQHDVLVERNKTLEGFSEASKINNIDLGLNTDDFNELFDKGIDKFMTDREANLQILMDREASGELSASEQAKLVDEINYWNNFVEKYNKSGKDFKEINDNFKAASISFEREVANKFGKKGSGDK